MQAEDIQFEAGLPRHPAKLCNQSFRSTEPEGIEYN